MKKNNLAKVKNKKLHIHHKNFSQLEQIGGK